ncbi:MAG TPA: EAL domain-containing protein [Verrucomicrobiae bacterium]|jgi:diguanylate cyclase (GGDEF)-like protein/PAS domain S-box-containing protein|nr:EAL domain-containing protein [Verrucomicrobiae bacterium]
MTSPGLKTAEPKNIPDRGERVLLIGPNVGDAARTLGGLGPTTDERFPVEWVAELSRGIKRLRTAGVGAVVFDLTSPDGHGLATFDQLFQAAAGVPILVLTGAGADEMGRQAVQGGAHDYLVKDQADAYRLGRTVRAMLDRRAAQVVSRENQAANLMLDMIGEAVLRTDKRGHVTYLNRIAETMTGWGREEALGRPVADVLHIKDGVSSDPIDIAQAIAKQAGEPTKEVTHCGNCILVRRDGSSIGIENRVSLICDSAGALAGSVVAFRDVSAARATSLEMSRLAQHDVLTGLPNRTLFSDRLTQAISLTKRNAKQLAVLFVDIDHFKKINDSLGHGVGDKLLRSVAGRLTASVRRTDTVSRLGGDEFVVLLSPVEHAEDAAFSARKILRTLAAPHVIDNKSLDINVSVGGSTFPEDGQDAESLVATADAAMYEAKQHGRNNYKFFRHDMHARLAKRLSLERDLRYALGQNQFVLHYQPKINLSTGQITGVEALIRWHHPQQGMLLPREFVSIAEECGLILPIGRWVLLEACKQARAWKDAGLGIVPVAVNVSAAEFGAKDFLSGVRAVLIATGVEPHNLELELTESVLMHDAESAVVTLLALKAMGVRLAIDDFGTGYSSFTYLLRFPVDALKLDQSFVQEITADPGGATIVSAMINIGKSLKQRVIAEGVETRDQLDFLQRHGCGEGQGYYFGHPVVAEQAGRLFKAA